MRSWVLLMALGAGVVILAFQPKATSRLQERTGTSGPDGQAVQLAAAPVAATPVSAPVTAHSHVAVDFSFGPRGKYQYLSDGGYYHSYDVVAVGDVTADGRDDVVALPGDNEIHLLIQQEDGQLADPRIFTYGDPVYSHPKELVLADFNGDGVLDVAGSSSQGQFHLQGGLNLLLSDGQGGLVFRQVLGHIERAVRDWSVLDVDLDGHLDIVGFENVIDYDSEAECGTTQYCPRYRIMYGDGDGGFERVATVKIGQPYGVAGAGTPDLNGDGHADLVFLLLSPTPGSEKVMAQYHDGRLGLLPPVELHSGPYGGGSMAFGDFNADGRTDTVLVHLQSWDYPEVRLRSATGSYSAPVALPTYMLRSPLLVSDFDGDGHDDIASVQMRAVSGYYQVSGAMNLQRNGALAPPLLSDSFWEADKVSTQRGGSAAGDVNGDGCQDFVFAASYEGIIVLPGQNCIPAPARRTAPPVSDDSGYRYLWTGPLGVAQSISAHVQATGESGRRPKPESWRDKRCDDLDHAPEHHRGNAAAARSPTRVPASSGASRRNCSGLHSPR